MNSIMHTQFYFRYLKRSPESSQANDPALGGYIYTGVNKLEQSHTSRQEESEKNSEPFQLKSAVEAGINKSAGEAGIDKSAGEAGINESASEAGIDNSATVELGEENNNDELMCMK